MNTAGIEDLASTGDASTGGARTGDASIGEVVFWTAAEARRLWMPLWPQWKKMGGHPDPDGLASTDVCIPASLALCAVLNRMVPEYRWLAVGGRPTSRTPHGGYCAGSGPGQPHMWVLGRPRSRRQQGLIGSGGVQGVPGQQCASHSLLVDITADQFGGPAVVVLENGVCGPGVDGEQAYAYHANYSRPSLARLREAEPLHVWIWVGVFDDWMAQSARP